MFWKKDNFLMGLIMGLVAPAIGICIFKATRFNEFSFTNMITYMIKEQGYRTLSAALSLSLLLNALLFTLYINSRKDNTAKGIFVTTLIYGLIILSIKTFL